MRSEGDFEKWLIRVMRPHAYLYKQYPSLTYTGNFVHTGLEDLVAVAIGGIYFLELKVGYNKPSNIQFSEMSNKNFYHPYCSWVVAERPKAFTLEYPVGTDLRVVAEWKKEEDFVKELFPTLYKIEASYKQKELL